MTNVEGNAREYRDLGYNCAQSTLKAILVEKGIFFKEAMALSSGFGGGIAGEGKTCGAVSGAIMAIGILNGFDNKNVVQSKERIYEIAGIFIERFKKKFETTQCYDLIGVDLKDPEAKKAAHERGVFSDKCSEFIAAAIGIVLTLFS